MIRAESEVIAVWRERTKKTHVIEKKVWEVNILGGGGRCRVGRRTRGGRRTRRWRRDG